MITLIQVIGIFFAIEGGANLVWWHFNPPADNANSKLNIVWESGRVARVILGLVLIFLV